MLEQLKSWSQDTITQLYTSVDKRWNSSSQFWCRGDGACMLYSKNSYGQKNT